MEILLAFDNDEAGQKATLRSIELIRKADKWWQAIIKYNLVDWFDACRDPKHWAYHVDWDALERDHSSRSKTAPSDFFKDEHIKYVFGAKIREFEEKIWEETKYRDNIYQGYESDAWKQAAMEASKEREMEYAKQARKFIFLKKQCRNEVLPEELKIQQAKEFPIGQLLAGSEPTGRRAFYRCPLHGEKTGSFCWYKKENKWWCFGESRGGDVIDLYMEINNCDFKTAVKQLAI